MLSDLIARSQYSITMSNTSAGSNRFVEIVRILTSPPAASEASWFASLGIFAFAFPFLKKILPNTLANPAHSKEFIQITKKMMDIRRQLNQASGSQAQGRDRDYLDHLLEWYDELETNAEYKKAGITDLSIYNLGILLFVASQDQISLILTSLIYFASQNSDIENKLRDEVDRIWEKSGGSFDHDVLSELTYLNACILEATRLYPFFIRMERICTKDWRDETRGIEIKRGQVVQIPIWAANRNPKYFENPDEFKPERFLPGNRETMHPYAFASFGFGPRNCLGKRLAMEIMVMLAAYLLRELKFVKRMDTKLTFIPAGPFIAAHEPILFDLGIRNK